MVVQLAQYAMLYLPSMELAASSTTQQTVMVVQSMHKLMSYCISLVLAVSRATLQYKVEPSLQILTALWYSMEALSLLTMATIQIN